MNRAHNSPFGPEGNDATVYFSVANAITASDVNSNAALRQTIAVSFGFAGAVGCSSGFAWSFSLIDNDIGTIGKFNFIG